MSDQNLKEWLATVLLGVYWYSQSEPQGMAGHSVARSVLVQSTCVIIRLVRMKLPRCEKNI